MTTFDHEPYTSDNLDALVTMWRASFETSVGVTDPHPIADQKRYFIEEVLPTHEVRVVSDQGNVIAFIAASSDGVAQLYVDVAFQGRGIGTMLLNWAKERSNGALWLYTFARNQGARSFYEKHGFRVTATGFEATWQLEDVRYEWTEGKTGTDRS
ncbi:MAG: GNAT family N-acetyltransferase [Planctomycetota bacterium]